MPTQREAIVEGQQGDTEPEAVSVDAEPAASSAPEEGQAEASFYTYKGDDGKETVFKTPDELGSHIKQGTLRYADYTRKTQQVAESRKMLEQRMKDYEDKERAFNQSYPEIRQMDQFLKENPAVRDEILKNMNGKVNPELEKILGERLGPLEEKLSKYEEEEVRRAEEGARNKAFDAIGAKYEDFDRPGIEQAIQRLQEVPQEMQLEALLEELYFGGKGRLTTGEVERKQAIKSTVSKPTPTPTKIAGLPEQDVTDMNNAELQAAALAAWQEVSPEK